MPAKGAPGRTELVLIEINPRSRGYLRLDIQALRGILHESMRVANYRLNPDFGP